MNEQTATEWRDCADPDELAAAVAAGVEVQWERYDGWVPSANQTADQFAGSLRAGITYRIPTDWSPEPPADDEPCATNPCEACRGRAVRATDECTLSPDRVGSPAGNDHPVTIPPADDLRERLRLGIEDAVNDYADVVMDIMDAEVVRHAGWLAARLEEADAERTTLRHRLVETMPTPPPAPPWPGDENDDTARLSPDQGDRIVNACCRMLGCEPADIDGDAALEEILTEAVERCADLHGQDRWEDDCHGCGFRVGDHTTDGRCPAPAAPVPPWPGAVLSGLTDEDGEPTWLALAPNVLGEDVRTCVDFPWFICGSDNAVTPYWVEVRAPRAVPEPETEPVPWWESVGRVVRDATGREAQILRADVGDGAGPSVYAYHDQEPGAALRRLYAPVNGSGFVEVLKDDEQ
jgi:hypothetical protein